MTGTDRPGILKRLTTCLADKSINIEDWECHFEGKVVTYTGSLTVPPRLSIRQLQSESGTAIGIETLGAPGTTAAETIAGIILDEAAIGMTNNKTTAVRVIPVPGKAAGEYVDFGGLFGAGTVTRPNAPDGAAAFVRRGGHVPAPLRSLGN